MTLDALAEATGLSTSHLSRLESGGRGASLEAMVKLSRALRVPVADLTDDYTEQDVLAAMTATSAETEAPKRRKQTEGSVTLAPHEPARIPIDVPVYGTAAASAVGQGAFILSDNIVDWIARPPGMSMAPDIYALEVRGDSMVPKYEPGEIVFVHPHRFYRPGDVVIVQEADTANGDPQAFIKIFENETPEAILTRQLNPECEVKFRRRDGIKVHKVLTMRELFGF